MLHSSAHVGSLVVIWLDTATEKCVSCDGMAELWLKIMQTGCLVLTAH